MITDLQLAPYMKRFAAFLLDIIVIVIISTGGALLMSYIVDYDSHYEKVQEYVAYYEETYDVKFLSSEEEYEALSDEEKERYDEVDKIIKADKDFTKEYQLIHNLIYIMVIFGALIGVLIPEFVIPLFLKNGQTIGKKAFGLVVIKPNGVRATNVQLLTRALLGKYTIEIMIPVLSIVTFVLGFAGKFGLIWFTLGCLIILLNILLVIFTRNHTMVHDSFSYTVVCSKDTQMIFDSEEALLKYKEEKHLNEVNNEKEYEHKESNKEKKRGINNESRTTKSYKNLSK